MLADIKNRFSRKNSLASSTRSMKLDNKSSALKKENFSYSTPTLNRNTSVASLPPPPPPVHAPATRISSLTMRQQEKLPMRNNSNSSSMSSIQSYRTNSSNSQANKDNVMSNSSATSSSSSLSSMPPTPKTYSRRSVRVSSNASLPAMINDYFMTHDHLKPGNNASLLSYDKTINLYRENAKRTNDPNIQCELAIFLYESSKSANHKPEENKAYAIEAVKILKSLASRGHADAQYYLANIYASGVLHKNGKPDFSHAFPLFVQAAKHHHADASYRAGKCYEDGLGCLTNKAKAIQYYKVAATLSHPGAMFRLGLAEIDGSLGLSRNVKDGEKWLKRSAVAATPEYPHALHELGLLHERGLDGVIFKDTQYSTKLYARAAQLGYAPSAFRLGECFEFGYLGCPKDGASSIYYYTIAARQGDANACFALSAWYLAGDLPRVPVSEEKALYWAKLAAGKELPKAEFALGYFAEAGIGRPKDKKEALEWYKKAAEHGEEQARKRIPIVTSALNAATTSSTSTNDNTASSTHLKMPASLVAGEAR